MHRNECTVPVEVGSQAAAACVGLSATVRPLLVTSSDAWRSAVQHAVRELGGGDVATCDARDAISRLARIAPHYSHLLVNEADADGLFKELAAIAIEIAEPDTDMLALGASGTVLPHIRVIRTPSTHSVRDALVRPPRAGTTAEFDAGELRAALAGTMIETRYQPIVRIRDRQPVGLEALARLNHPDRGTILPDRFIPQIEDAGLAADLTRIVAGRAFADLTGPFLAARGLRVSLNFPLDVLATEAARQMLERQRQARGIDAGHIIIELTESTPVSDIVALRGAIERLRTLGYGVAIDDINPVIENLRALLELPFTWLKFDKDIVQQAEARPELLDFIARCTELGRRRGMFVIAEGVETESIWRRMDGFGVDAAQGFLAARPLPVAAVPIWWDSWLGSTAGL